MKSTNTAKIAQEVASILLDIGAVIFRPRQPFRYSSGILSPVYCDNRLLMSYPIQRERVVMRLTEEIKKIGRPDLVAAVATAGIAPAAFVAQKMRLPMVYVRSSPKDHGKASQVEGLVRRKQKVIVIEDLVSTGGSSTKVVEALRKIGAKVSHEICIFTYRLKESEQNFKKNKINLQPLCTLEDTLQVAKKRGYLKLDQLLTIRQWSRDPKNWAKKMGFENG